MQVMIRYIEGGVVAVETDFAVVNVQGVGYKVFTTPENLALLTKGLAATFHTHLAVRETALDLYGFSSLNELALFELLLSVSGIGPKSALGVLSLADSSTIRTAVRDQNAAHLSKVSGIGKKTAEKIVLELKDKMHFLGDSPEGTHIDEEALDALRAMGYTLQEAREALKVVPREVTDSSARLREALKALAS